jgi:DNA-directed RNA polymerase specialized sigma24 family protein
MRNTARRVQDELRELKALRTATKEAAQEEGQRVYRALAEHNRRSARNAAEYASNPDTYVWLAVFNILNIYDQETEPDHLEILRHLDAYMASLGGSVDRPQPPSADTVAELQRRFDQLSPESQAVFQLCQHHGLSPTEIATRAGTPVFLVQELLVAALCALDTGTGRSA